MSGVTMAYVGLGANLGDRVATLRSAVGQLGDLGCVSTVSSLYETAPVGYEAQPPFLNAVVALQTSLAAPELVQALLRIEERMGRTRSFRNAPRTLDLDLLLMQDQVVETAATHVPHPRLHERAFVLGPLAEIAPLVVHPILQQSVQTLRDDLGDLTGIRRICGPDWASRPVDAAESVEDY